jgi:hypothetical protein
MKTTTVIGVMLTGMLLMSPAASWSEESEEQAVVYQDELKETKALLEQAQKDVEASKAFNAPVQKHAKKRMNELQKECDQLTKKADRAAKEQESVKEASR